jgi:hypothetical protein
MKFIVEDGWIFFSGYADDDVAGFFKMRIDGSELQRINNDLVFYFNAYDGWIYYLITETPYVSNGIYRIRTNGTERETVGEWSDLRSMTFYFNATTEWLYLAVPTRNEALGRNTTNMFRIRNDGTHTENVYQTVQ